MNYVQAYIANISFPKTLAEVYGYADQFDMETILLAGSRTKNGERRVEWTAPKWCKQGDVVLFMHAKTANSRISKLKTQLLSKKDSYSDEAFKTLMDALGRAKELYKQYGGKIFAVGRISGEVIYDDFAAQDELHWKSSIYAPIEHIFLLETPIDISEFNHKILISRQSSITPVLGEDYRFLKQLILLKNHIDEPYFRESAAEPLPLCRLNNENWLYVTSQYRRSFFLEIQFRNFYVNRLLRFTGDTKNFYRECSCYKGQKSLPRVDNVIRFRGKYLLVEVKLSVAAEKDIVRQLSSYCDPEQIKLSKNRTIESGFYRDMVLVIDTDNIYMYYDRNQKLKTIYQLDDIKTLGDIGKVKEAIATAIARGEKC